MKRAKIARMPPVENRSKNTLATMNGTEGGILIFFLSPSSLDFFIFLSHFSFHSNWTAQSRNKFCTDSHLSFVFLNKARNEISSPEDAIRSWSTFVVTHNDIYFCCSKTHACNMRLKHENWKTQKKFQFPSTHPSARAAVFPNSNESLSWTAGRFNSPKKSWRPQECLDRSLSDRTSVASYPPFWRIFEWKDTPWKLIGFSISHCRCMIQTNSYLHQIVKFVLFQVSIPKSHPESS